MYHAYDNFFYHIFVHEWKCYSFIGVNILYANPNILLMCFLEF
ncbi:hypothetical protein E2C01_042094 [Portunus trituberculatus]|uniref:Uncharacterized protein n=1 Tax=Portunus trituberculatus TaxID=210409 RepID=A0A5B7FS42_PORTR|nr:hypothetical protein [Portunus trituberculatus]